MVLFQNNLEILLGETKEKPAKKFLKLASEALFHLRGVVGVNRMFRFTTLCYHTLILIQVNLDLSKMT